MTRSDLINAIDSLRKRTTGLMAMDTRVNLLLQAVEIAASNGLTKNSGEIYREVLHLKPNHLPALEGLASALLVRG